ncbi:hypothetical protein ANTRET_LOCUS4196 [Anthophora retusa]
MRNVCGLMRRFPGNREYCEKVFVNQLAWSPLTIFVAGPDLNFSGPSLSPPFTMAKDSRQLMVKSLRPE